METTVQSPRTEKKLMSYEEYLAWADEDVHSEWVNGEVIVFMPPKNPHQLVVGFLDQVIGLFIRIFDLGRLWIAPFELKIHPAGSSREPDLMFLAKAHLDRLSDERIIGPPDLIIEVVSADSVHRDRVEKLDEYEAGGVPEYWIIDNHTRRPRAWFYQLGADGNYQPVVVGADGIYHSKVLPGFWLRLEWLWAAEPDPLRALAEIIGPERMAQALRQALADAPSATNDETHSETSQPESR
jgi:Uma2 family endonuclease